MTSLKGGVEEVYSFPFLTWSVHHVEKSVSRNALTPALPLHLEGRKQEKKKKKIREQGHSNSCPWESGR